MARNLRPIFVVVYALRDLPPNQGRSTVHRAAWLNGYRKDGMDVILQFPYGCIRIRRLSFVRFYLGPVKSPFLLFL